MKGFIKRAAIWLGKHERVILTCVTIGAEVIAIYEAVKNGPEFEKVTKQVKDEEITKKEAAKKLVVPAVKIAVPFAVSSGAAILNHKKASDTIASISNLYTITKTVSDEYKAQVEKELGPEKAAEIEGRVNQNQAARSMNGGSNGDVVHITGHGTDKFYDAWSGRWFYSDINYIKRVVNDKNLQLQNDMYISLNEFYSDLDIPTTDSGREQGWNVDFGKIDVAFEACLDENDKPYTVMSFKSAPGWMYEKRNRW